MAGERFDQVENDIWPPGGDMGDERLHIGSAGKRFVRMAQFAARFLDYGDLRENVPLRGRCARSDCVMHDQDARHQAFLTAASNFWASDRGVLSMRCWAEA